MALNARQRAFVAAYKGNAGEAARIAGYGAPETCGPRMLKNAQIRAALAQIESATLAPLIASKQEVQQRCTQIARESDDDSVRLKAMELLSKTRGDLKDRLEVQGKLTLEQLVAEATKEK